MVAMTVQVYVATFADPVGPVVEGHADVPAEFVTVQVPKLVGRLAPTGPAAVAVKEIADPRTAVALSALTSTTGDCVVTVAVSPDIGALAE